MDDNSERVEQIHTVCEIYEGFYPSEMCFCDRLNSDCACERKTDKIPSFMIESSDEFIRLVITFDSAKEKLTEIYYACLLYTS